MELFKAKSQSTDDDAFVRVSDEVSLSKGLTLASVERVQDSHGNISHASERIKSSQVGISEDGRDLMPEGGALANFSDDEDNFPGKDANELDCNDEALMPSPNAKYDQCSPEFYKTEIEKES